MARLTRELALLGTLVVLSACHSEPSSLDTQLAAAPRPAAPQTSRGSAQALADSHHDHGMLCADCHVAGMELDDGESAENSACVGCHAAQTLGDDAPSTAVTPHDSHLGKVYCTLCHHGHTFSQSYCTNCHIFEFRIPFDGVPAFSDPALQESLHSEDTTDIVVVGSGGAGLTAAIAAADLGARVVVIEKQPLTGGNTLLSAGGMNAANTKYQQALGIEDSVALMISDTLRAAGPTSHPDLVEVMANQSSASVDWLTTLGVDLSDVGKLAGASVKRAHRPKNGKAIGPHLIQVLRGAVETRKLDLRVNTKATRLLEDETGRLVGLEVVGKHRQRYAIRANAIVLAAGGFSANIQRVVAYRGDYAGMTSTNQPGATGDGMDLGASLGAELLDMDQIQIHPTLGAGTRILITEAVRGNGAVLVNHEGQRFVNEMATRAIVAAAVLALPERTALLVFDEAVRSSLDQVAGYAALGLLTRADTLDKLASEIGLPAAALVSTVASYNDAYTSDPNREDPNYHRAIPQAIATPPFYAIEVTPGVHYTMGGLSIDVGARVLRPDGSAILGLYAAGENTGGIHGADRLGGNSISEAITFGKIAGENAAHWCTTAH